MTLYRSSGVLFCFVLCCAGKEGVVARGLDLVRQVLAKATGGKEHSCWSMPFPISRPPHDTSRTEYQHQDPYPYSVRTTNPQPESAVCLWYLCSALVSEPGCTCKGSMMEFAESHPLSTTIRTKSHSCHAVFGASFSACSRSLSRPLCGIGNLQPTVLS